MLSKVKLSPFVEDDQKAPFSVATKPRCRRGRYSFPWIAYLILLSVKQGGIKYHVFKVFGMTQPGIEPRSPGPLANTPPTRPISRFKWLANLVEGDQKAPLSLATKPRCRGGRYSFPWIAPLYP